MGGGYHQKKLVGFSQKPLQLVGVVIGLNGCKILEKLDFNPPSFPLPFN